MHAFFFDLFMVFIPECNQQQGRIQDFKLGGGGGAHLKIIGPSGGRHEHFWGITCEKSRFYAKQSYFSNFREGGRRVRPPLESAPEQLRTRRYEILYTLNMCCSLLTLREPCINQRPRCDIAWVQATNHLYHVFPN